MFHDRPKLALATTHKHCSARHVCIWAPKRLHLPGRRVKSCGDARPTGDVHLSTRDYFETRVPLRGHGDTAASTIVDFRNQVAGKLEAQRVWTQSASEFEVRTSCY